MESSFIDPSQQYHNWCTKDTFSNLFIEPYRSIEISNIQIDQGEWILCGAALDKCKCVTIRILHKCNQLICSLHWARFFCDFPTLRLYQLYRCMNLSNNATRRCWKSKIDNTKMPISSCGGITFFITAFTSTKGYSSDFYKLKNSKQANRYVGVLPTTVNNLTTYVVALTSSTAIPKWPKAVPKLYLSTP